MILFVTHTDTDLLTLSRAVRFLPQGFPRVRGIYLGESKGIEELLEAAWNGELASTKLVVLRLLGGRRAVEGGERLFELLRGRKIPLIALPAEMRFSPDLASLSTLPMALIQRAFDYLCQGGIENFKNFLLSLSDQCLGSSYAFAEPKPLPTEGIYHPDLPSDTSLEALMAARFEPKRPTLGILFYRSHWMSGNLEFIDSLIRSIEGHGGNVLTLFCYSLRGDGVKRLVDDFLRNSEGQSRVDALISTLSFSVGEIGQDGHAGGISLGLLEQLGVPIFQALISTDSHATWEERACGLSPLDVAMNVAIPEFDGRIITVPFSFKEKRVHDEILGVPVRQYVPREDRVDFLARLSLNWARLRRKPSRERKVGILLTNYPSKNSRIGNAVGLDTPASVVRLLNAMKEAGYQLGPIPRDGDALIQELIARCSNDQDALTQEQIEDVPGQVEAKEYARWFSQYPGKIQRELRTAWGEPPGELFFYKNRLMIQGLVLGNIFIGLQPPRGFGENPIAIYHSPDLAPTHHYLATYQWLREVFHADAIIHMGKHGTLEWLPGKSVGLSSACCPEVALSDLPHFYPFIINNPGEGTQAKRRSHAVIIDHMVPPMTRAESYGELLKVEQLLDEYSQVQLLDPKKIPYLRQEIWQAIREAKLDTDLKREECPADFDHFLQEVDGYLCELKDAQIRDGLHILGQVPEGEQLVNLLLAMTRLDNLAVPSLRTAIAEALGISYPDLLVERGKPFSSLLPPVLNGDGSTPISCGEVIEKIDALASKMLWELKENQFALECIEDLVSRFLSFPHPATVSVLRFIAAWIYPRLVQTTDEITHLLEGLEGRFVLPGPSGAPTRGMAHVLPTGRNFYSIDPRSLPSPAAWKVGVSLGQQLLKNYLAESGRYPETVGLVLWGTSAMRTQGEDVAEFLYLVGVKPVWEQENRRVKGLELIPLERLGRPRIDVMARISGFFRDAFPHLIHLMDQAVEMVAGQDEKADENYLVKHFHQEPSLYRIFGSKPGGYGAGILPLLQARNWKTDQDLAEIYTRWGDYAYSQTDYGEEKRTEFQALMRSLDVAVKNQDNREHDIFDSDDYLQFHGGMIATVRALTGKNPRAFFGDSSDPAAVKVRDLKDEALRVYRTRVINPKWIRSAMRHGYKGALEMAATVDYLYGYDATARIAEDWMYEKLAERYALDSEIQRFFTEKNPWALQDIAERLLEAADRGLWEKPAEETIAALKQTYLQVEEWLERGQEKKEDE
jgi:cobaltochelatase CobN